MYSHTPNTGPEQPTQNRTDRQARKQLLILCTGTFWSVVYVRFCVGCTGPACTRIPVRVKLKEENESDCAAKKEMRQYLLQKKNVLQRQIECCSLHTGDRIEHIQHLDRIYNFK